MERATLNRRSRGGPVQAQSDSALWPGGPSWVWFSSAMKGNVSSGGERELRNLTPPPAKMPVVPTCRLGHSACPCPRCSLLEPSAQRECRAGTRATPSQETPTLGEQNHNRYKVYGTVTSRQETGELRSASHGRDFRACQPHLGLCAGWESSPPLPISSPAMPCPCCPRGQRQAANAKFKRPGTPRPSCQSVETTRGSSMLLKQPAAPSPATAPFLADDRTRLRVRLNPPKRGSLFHTPTLLESFFSQGRLQGES